MSSISVTRPFSPGYGGASGKGPRGAIVSAPAENPIYMNVKTWLLFWPLLTLIARQSVYLSGPAKSAEAIQNGSARGSHVALYIMLLIEGCFAIAGYRGIWKTLSGNLLLMASLVLSGVSALWSASPTITLQMTVEIGLCVFFACYLYSQMPIDRLMRVLIFMGVCASLLSILFAIALPSYGIFAGYGGGAWQGITNHKNTLGISSAFLLTPVFFTRSLSRNEKLIYAALMLFMVAMSQSRGAWIDTAGMLAFVGWLHLMRRVRTRESILLLITTLILIVGTIVLVRTNLAGIARLLGKDPSLSGRTGIYIEVWHSIMKQPWFGYGFGGFWYPGSLESQRVGLALGWMNIGYSESGVLELALQTGFVGLGLVLLMIGRAAVQGIRLLRTPFYTPQVGWYLTIFFLATLTNLDAGWLMTTDTLDWVLIMIACFGLNDETRAARYGMSAGRGQIVVRSSTSFGGPEDAGRRGPAHPLPVAY